MTVIVYVGGWCFWYNQYHDAVLISLMFRDVKVKAETVYHCDQHDLPVFGCQRKRITTAEALNILLDPNLDRQKVCTSQPVAIEQNRLFVVDLSHLDKPKDLLCDDVGSWICDGNYTSWVKVDELGDVDRLGKSRADIETSGSKAATGQLSSKCKGASKKTTAGIRLLMQNADEKEMTKRAGIETSGSKAVTGQRSSAQASRSTLSSASTADALCNTRHGVSMSSSVVWPLSSSSPLLILSPSTTASPGMTSTPQPAGPPPLIQCATPVSALA